MNDFLCQMVFERTAVGLKPDELIAHDVAALRDDKRMAPDLIFRNRSFLDILGPPGLQVQRRTEHTIPHEPEDFVP